MHCTFRVEEVVHCDLNRKISSLRTRIWWEDMYRNAFNGRAACCVTYFSLSLPGGGPGGGRLISFVYNRLTGRFTCNFKNATSKFPNEGRGIRKEKRRWRGGVRWGVVEKENIFAIFFKHFFLVGTSFRCLYTHAENVQAQYNMILHVKTSFKVDGEFLFHFFMYKFEWFTNSSYTYTAMMTA